MTCVFCVLNIIFYHFENVRNNFNCTNVSIYIYFLLMNHEVLVTLSLEQLENYRQTLYRRNQDLKAFNKDLTRQSVELAAKLNKLRVEAHKKTLSSKNFNFDDLYTYSRDKVGQYVWGSWGMAKSLVGMSGGKKKGKKSTTKEGIDVNADFNSYDLTPKTSFDEKNQNKKHTAEEKPRKKIFSPLERQGKEPPAQTISEQTKQVNKNEAQNNDTEQHKSTEIPPKKQEQEKEQKQIEAEKAEQNNEKQVNESQKEAKKGDEQQI